MTNELRILLIAVGSIWACACVPVEPAEDRVIGTWQVEWQCGKKTLELRRDRTYEQRVDYESGSRGETVAAAARRPRAGSDLGMGPRHFERQSGYGWIHTAVIARARPPISDIFVGPS